MYMFADVWLRRLSQLAETNERAHTEKKLKMKRHEGQKWTQNG